MDPLKAEPVTLEELQRVLGAMWAAGKIDAGQVRSLIKEFKEKQKLKDDRLRGLQEAAKLF